MDKNEISYTSNCIKALRLWVKLDYEKSADIPLAEWTDELYKEKYKILRFCVEEFFYKLDKGNVPYDRDDQRTNPFTHSNILK